jgi:hypothetical protein
MGSRLQIPEASACQLAEGDFKSPNGEGEGKSITNRQQLIHVDDS